ncbi:toxin HicA [Pleurocapsa sp. CCALA 161]|uniref:type II toxin-antitoxin system HicA family toxin n=1 Tax=Pleurocapsa sp. CCALA 161 TaxID=2107688 RepID=UPI000D070248|nr:type II toxin-antitoxin system HicA family toxin [Pleurocapsa sp. CCALA 161]PSB12669.1 toxin HicA [Pleurocapsa sp. CCALA 161]
MGKYEKLLQKILTGTSDHNIKFSELRQLLKKMGFKERIRGDRYFFTKDNVEEIINIQPQNSKAKSYQVKQIRNLIVKYSLGDSDVD